MWWQWFTTDATLLSIKADQTAPTLSCSIQEKFCVPIFNCDFKYQNQRYLLLWRKSWFKAKFWTHNWLWQSHFNPGTSIRLAKRNWQSRDAMTKDKLPEFTRMDDRLWETCGFYYVEINQKSILLVKLLGVELVWTSLSTAGCNSTVVWPLQPKKGLRRNAKQSQIQQ